MLFDIVFFFQIDYVSIFAQILFSRLFFHSKPNFACQVARFSGLFKHRFEDFHVHEIDEDGVTVRKYPCLAFEIVINQSLAARRDLTVRAFDGILVHVS